MTTIFLLLDAFRGDYLDDTRTPFLARCSREGAHYKGVVQSLGFCERTEVLTGMKGNESGFFTAIGFDPDHSAYKGSRVLPLFHLLERIVLAALCVVPPQIGNKIHKRLRGYSNRYFRRQGINMPSFLIPFTWLRYFALTEDQHDHRDPEAFPRPSILQLATEAGRTYTYDYFTALGLETPYRTDQGRLDGIVAELSTDRKDLYLVYISIPDAHGHRLGPDSEEFHTILQDMDQRLETFVRDAEKTSSDIQYIFLGDHGMLNVTDHFDAERAIKSMLRGTGLKIGRDVLYFLDSTMVRFWAQTPKAKETLPQILAQAEAFAAHGHWMDLETAEKFDVKWPDPRYGDHVWMANPGVQVFPDFFHRVAPCKGMHGYDPNLPESQGTCIIWGRGVQSKTQATLPLSGVFDLLKESLGL